MQARSETHRYRVVTFNSHKIFCVYQLNFRFFAADLFWNKANTFPWFLPFSCLLFVESVKRLPERFRLAHRCRLQIKLPSFHVKRDRKRGSNRSRTAVVSRPLSVKDAVYSGLQRSLARLEHHSFSVNFPSAYQSWESRVNIVFGSICFWQRKAKRKLLTLLVVTSLHSTKCAGDELPLSKALSSGL